MSSKIAYNLSEKKEVKGASEEVHLNVVVAKKYAEKAKNATDKGQDFNLPYDEFYELVKDGMCHYTGSKITNIEKASIERINPLKGYVSGNVCLVDADVNMFKGATIDNFLRKRFGNSMPRCIAELLNICNKTAKNMNLDVQFNPKTDLFSVHTKESLQKIADNNLLSKIKQEQNGIFGKRAIVKIESRRSKYNGEHAVILRTKVEEGVAKEYEVLVLIEGYPKVKVKQVSKVDLGG